MRNSTMSFSKKGNLHNCSLRSKKHQRTWDKLIILMKKFLIPAQSFFTRTSTERPVHEPSSNLSQKRKSSRDLENKQIRILLERKKSKFLLKSDLRSRSTNFKAESDRSIVALSGSIDTITRCEHSKRDQLLQEEISEQNRDLCETCIRNMRDIWRIAEKSRVKGRGAFKKKIDWRLWGSNFILPGLECQDSLHPWRQPREAPRCWDWRRAHQEFAGFTTVPSGARSKCEHVAGSLLAKEKACFKVHSQF